VDTHWKPASLLCELVCGPPSPIHQLVTRLVAGWLAFHPTSVVLILPTTIKLTEACSASSRAVTADNSSSSHKSSVCVAPIGGRRSSNQPHPLWTLWLAASRQLLISQSECQSSHFRFWKRDHLRLHCAGLFCNFVLSARAALLGFPSCASVRRMHDLLASPSDCAASRVPPLCPQSSSIYYRARAGKWEWETTAEHTLSHQLENS
jgi:hypothetical protein